MAAWSRAASREIRMEVLKGAEVIGIREFDMRADSSPSVGCILGSLCTVKAPVVPLLIAHIEGRLCRTCQQVLCCDVCMASDTHRALDKFMVRGHNSADAQLPFLCRRNRVYPFDRVAAFSDRILNDVMLQHRATWVLSLGAGVRICKR